jgi:hypothetical protein
MVPKVWGKGEGRIVERKGALTRMERESIHQRNRFMARLVRNFLPFFLLMFMFSPAVAHYLNAGPTSNPNGMKIPKDPVIISDSAYLPEGKIAEDSPVTDLDNNGKVSSSTWTTEMQRVNAAGAITETIISNVWAKGKRMRVERFRKVFDGTLRLSAILISDGEAEYTYRPGDSKVVRIPKGYRAEDLARKWVTQKSEESIGFEVLDGKPCQVFRVINEVDLKGLLTVRVEVKEWRWKEYVLKSITKTDGDPGADTRIIVVKDLRLDASFADTLFELPAGLRIEEMPLPVLDESRPFDRERSA